ncbi:hypothetical protein JN11_00002 [Mucilaginibacter frigoritolerans]|uniref:Dolichyl-phosphate-mannose-protein mannosyltransferase n=1 Tax=Mucilaginibacter frigoritolerans TaxID=652788 RepID=A0A562UEW1_9SPHI|nr:hypothetical protein [Mucilaginibacter frigoritolerans]TWJ04294.1 hypothetical protein JN11_00002 [Mucilaginibacter frigoritolerans]
MKTNPTKYLLPLTILLGVYYLLMGIYLNRLGYFSQEGLFYIEKTKIVLEGFGNRLKVMGLTAPILPFYLSFIFSAINAQIAPVIASALCTAILFYILASTVLTTLEDTFYLFILLLIFTLHPGILYAACSGKSVAMVLVFFLLFFFNLLQFYRSNTTFHVSIASICLVMLIFCDYKFIWLTLFFIPLVLSITVKSLKLGEQESIFRLFQSFNNPSLRRKLINKTFALYIILFILPLACVVCYKLLNLTHAQDLNYFDESPYATWRVLADKLSFDQLSTTAIYQLPETSILLSARIIIFCPLILVAVYLFKNSTYQMLTLLTPFAFVEFLHIKYEKVFLAHEYYLIFLILSLLCIIYKSKTVKNQEVLKLIVGVLALMQLYTGYFFLQNSSIREERIFSNILFNRTPDARQDENRDLANYLNHLPNDAHVLIDDAIAYPVVAFTDNLHKLTLPYEGAFLSAIEAPDKYDNYVLLATEKNEVTGFTELNNKYIPVIKNSNSALKLRRVFETNDWILYKVFDQ